MEIQLDHAKAPEKPFSLWEGSEYDVFVAVGGGEIELHLEPVLDPKQSLTFYLSAREADFLADQLHQAACGDTGGDGIICNRLRLPSP